MPRPLRRLRSALTFALAAGALVVVAASSGCSSAPGTEGASESSSQDLSIIKGPSCNPGYGFSCNPLCTYVCEPYLTTEAYPGNPSAPDKQCVLTQPIPIPPELAGEGCSLGGEYYVDGDPGPDQLASRIWACPLGAKVPKTIAGGYFPDGSIIVVNTTGEGYCLGAPHPGFELIEQDPLIISRTCNGGCPSQQ